MPPVRRESAIDPRRAAGIAAALAEKNCIDETQHVEDSDDEPNDARNVTAPNDKKDAGNKTEDEDAGNKTEDEDAGEEDAAPGGKNDKKAGDKDASPDATPDATKTDTAGDKTPSLPASPVKKISSKRVRSSEDEDSDEEHKRSRSRSPVTKCAGTEESPCRNSHCPNWGEVKD